MSPVVRGMMNDRSTGKRVIVGVILTMIVATGLGLGRMPRAIDFVIEAPPALSAVAERLKRIDPTRFQRPLAWVPPVAVSPEARPVRVILASSSSAWAERVFPWVAAYAVPQRRLVVMFPDRIGAYPYDSLENVFVHEMTHLLVGQAVGDRSLPRWFDEGLAMVAMRTWGWEDRARWAWAVIAGNPVPFAEIDDLFQRDRASAHRAYILADAVVRYCLRKFGPRWPRRMVTALAAGQPFVTAFEQAGGVSLAEVQSAFWADQTVWKRWVPVLASSAVLWAGIVLLAVWVSRRQRRRAQILRQQWEDDEDKEL